MKVDLNIIFDREFAIKLWGKQKHVFVDDVCKNCLLNFYMKSKERCFEDHQFVILEILQEDWNKEGAKEMQEKKVWNYLNFFPRFEEIYEN